MLISVLLCHYLNTFLEESAWNFQVVVFSKSYCPYCNKAKKALNSFPLKNDAIEVIEINKRNDCEEIQDYMQQLTGARYVSRNKLFRI